MSAEGDPFYLLLMLLKYFLGKISSLAASVVLLALVLFVGACFVTAMQDHFDSFDARAFLLRTLGMILWAVLSGVKVTISTFAKPLLGSSSFSFGTARPSALPAGSAPGSFPAGQGEALVHDTVVELKGPVADVINSLLLCIWFVVVKIWSWVGELWFRLPCNRPLEEQRTKWRIAENSLGNELRN